MSICEDLLKRPELRSLVSHNAKTCLKLDNQTVSEEVTLRSWGPFNFGWQSGSGNHVSIENTDRNRRIHLRRIRWSV